jgi:ABC-type dipeptide/oligopeptide/nickel transport system permease subunit
MQPDRSNLFACLFIFVIMAIVLGYIANYLHPFQIDISQTLLPPSPTHLFGTDSLGRDMFARTLSALGLSLRVVLQAMGISFVFALLFGGIAGYFHGRFIDHAICWLISLIFTIPFILIVLAIFAVVQPGLENAFLVIGCIAWAAPARLVRTEVIQLRNALFVTTQKAFGFDPAQIIVKTILPLCFFPALLSLLYLLPELIGVEVGLSFYGLGVQPPIPSLGRLIYEGLSEFYSGWWLTIAPATVLFLLTSTLYLTIPKVEVWKN